MDSMAKFWLQEGHTYELVVAQACVVLPWFSSTCHGLSLGVPLWTQVTRGTRHGVMVTFVHLLTPLMSAWNPVPPVQVAVSGPVFCQGLRSPLRDLTQLPFLQHLIQIISFTLNRFIPLPVLKSLQ